VGQRSLLFEEGKEKGYFLKNLQGDVWQTDEWQSGMAIVDFTNPAAVRWFQSKLEAVIDTGVDSFKTDFGERIPTNVVYHDGSDPLSMHNYYTFLYNKAVFEVLERRFGKGGACLFARSATAGSQQFPVHWGGDSEAHFSSMAETLRGGLSLGLAGFGFWSHDIGGFGNKATPDLYKRWVAFGLLSSHSRLHGDSTYRVPWNYDEEAVDVLRFFTELKCALMPYLYAKAWEAVTFGWPILRPMMFEFPHDKACEYLDTQYMLGESILVAPVFRPDGVVDYYLPDGKWTHLLDGSVRSGGRWHKETYGYFSLPIFAKECSLIAFGRDRTKPDYSHTVGTVFHYFSGTKNELSVTLYDEKGEQAGLELKKEGNRIEVKANGQLQEWSLLLRNEKDRDNVKTEEADVTLVTEGLLLKPHKNSGFHYYIRINDNP
jgi:alpha-D-xyloside xylohydrolase